MEERNIKFIVAVFIQISILIICFLALCARELPVYQVYLLPAALIGFLTQLLIFIIWGWFIIFKREKNFTHNAKIINDEVVEITKRRK